MKLKAGKELLEKQGHEKCKICKKGYLVPVSVGFGYPVFACTSDFKLDPSYNHYFQCSNCQRKFEVIEE